MTIGMGDVVAGLLLTGFCALAWCRRRNVGGKTWAFRVVPIGALLLMAFARSKETFYGLLLATFAAYALAAHWGGWRLADPRNRCLNAVWWMTHIVAYFLLAFIVCVPVITVVRSLVRWSPIATAGDWPWTKGEVTGKLPFAIEYRRLKTFCAEYDKRLLFRSGKRIGLLMDTCGFGPFRVYRLRDGSYCLEDGYDGVMESRLLRVNVEKETVEVRQGSGWYPLPEKGFVRGWGGTPGALKMTFNMYPGGDLNGSERWSVDVVGTPLGDSLEGKSLIGEIDTLGRFSEDE